MKDVSMLSTCQGNSIIGLLAKQRKYRPTGVSLDVMETSIFSLGLATIRLVCWTAVGFIISTAMLSTVSLCKASGVKLQKKGGVFTLGGVAPFCLTHILFQLASFILVFKRAND